MVTQAPYIVTITVIAPLLFCELKDARLALIWTAMVGGLLCLLALAFGKWGARGCSFMATSSRTKRIHWHCPVWRVRCS